MGLGHRRLKIIDLSDKASQPMHTMDGRFHIVFNGEIYNYLELRDELSDVVFRSSSDTEVLLNVFARGGIRSLSKLNGIFSFAAYDNQSENLWLIRDPLGVKPLYYFKDERGFFFASEIRALLKVMTFKPSLRFPLLSRYLMINWIPDPDTLFDGIQKLEAGHYLLIKPDLSTEVRPYWDLSFHQEEDLSLKDWVTQLDRILGDTMKRQLRSDVPVAFFLSGGLDSSLIATKAVQTNGGEPTTFTIGFSWSSDKSAQSDLSFARLLKDRFPFQFKEMILGPSIVEILPRVIDALEEPLADPAAICSYLICEAASKEFRVLVSGQGADEIFGGYDAYRIGQLAYGIQQLPHPIIHLADLASRMLPYSVKGIHLQSIHRLKKLVPSLRHAWPEPFLLLRSPLRMENVAKLLLPHILAIQSNPFDRHREHFNRSQLSDPVNQLLYLDTKTYLVNNNLAYSDKTSMAHSVELRVPYLDLELVRLAQRVPSRFKTTFRESKILLKALAGKSLPSPIIHRKKVGFGLPLRNWMLHDLQPMAKELLMDQSICSIFNTAVIRRWLKEHEEKVADHSMRLFNLMTLRLWMNNYKFEL